jgi:hypothetical protein
MAQREITLEVAAFLDSARGKALAAPGRAEQKRIVEAFLGVVYEELGKSPKHLDGQDLHVALGHLLPARFERKDPLAVHVPAVLEAYLAHLEETEIVPEIFELRRALVATAPEFEETVRTGQNAHQHAAPQKPFVHGAPKLGRNDLCSCGSGKKFKKCHGKGS